MLNKLHKAISHTLYIYKNEKSSLVQLVLIIITKHITSLKSVGLFKLKFLDLSTPITPAPLL